MMTKAQRSEVAEKFIVSIWWSLDTLKILNLLVPVVMKLEIVIIAEQFIVLMWWSLDTLVKFKIY